MINPVLIIITAAVLLSMLVVCIINKPKKPFFTAASILVLLFYVGATLYLDNTISALGAAATDDAFIHFLTTLAEPDYRSLGDSFHTFMLFDIGIFLGSMVSMFIEIMIIFRKTESEP